MGYSGSTEFVVGAPSALRKSCTKPMTVAVVEPGEIVELSITGTVTRESLTITCRPRTLAIGFLLPPRNVKGAGLIVGKGSATSPSPRFATAWLRQLTASAAFFAWFGWLP